MVLDRTFTRIMSLYESRHFTSPAASRTEADMVEAPVDSAVAYSSAEKGSNICVLLESLRQVRHRRATGGGGGRDSDSVTGFRVDG